MGGIASNLRDPREVVPFEDKAKTNPPEAEIRPLEEIACQIENAIDRLNRELSRLQLRLNPVLCPGPDEDEAPREGEVQSCGQSQFAQRLSHSVYNIGAMEKYVATILEDLEI